MNNNSWFKKEKPMVTLSGLGGGSASNLYWRPAGGTSYTYVDDVFSTHVYGGTGSPKTINNGIKLSNANAGNSVDFNGSTDYLSIVDSTDWDLSGVDFTVECWYYPRSNPSWVGLVGQWPVSGVNTQNSWLLEPVGSQLTFHFQRTNSSYSNVSAPGTLQTNQWQHCAAVCKNGDIKVFLNGYGSSWTSTSGTLQNTTSDLTIGGNVAPNYGAGWADGLISNVRITKGQCLYENNFTPSTEALTTTSQGATASNVKLLCCNSSIITSGTVTPNGTISVGAGDPRASYGPFTASDGEEGLVWLKCRNSSQWHYLFDTVNGGSKYFYSNDTSDLETNGNETFNNSGFTIGSGWGTTNQSGNDYSSWTFRKASGFFDIQTWSGNSSAGRQISHDLGCVPGMVIVKSTINNGDWMVYHRASKETHRLKLNEDVQASTTSSWNNTIPTSTHVTLGSNTGVNASGTSYVGYFFAGGESTDATARSVSFDGVTYNQRLDIADTTDLEIGSSEFTMECWFRQDTNAGGGSGSHTLMAKWDNDGRKEFIFRISEDNSKQVLHWLSSSNGSSNDASLYGDTKISNGTWNHAAVTRDSSGKIRMFLNGLLQKNMGTQSSTHADSHEFMIGANGSSGVEQYMSGDISNVRFIKGQCLWTSSFRPTNEPLTTTSQGAISSNVKLLCCNDSSPTGSTVTPGTITNFNSLTASTDSPFDDLNSSVYGENQDEIIKVGSYIGQPYPDSHIYLGWEPQWIMIKNHTQGSEWLLIDNVRGVPTEGETQILMPNKPDVENSWSSNYINFNQTGFSFGKSGNTYVNSTGQQFNYVAIRRQDGYVGKPLSHGSDCFAMDMGDGSSPTFKSGFPVDWALRRMPTGGSGTDMDWVVYARLMGLKYLRTNTTDDQSTSSRAKWDYMRGINHTDNNTYQSWLFKRHAGCDVITYMGNGGQLSVPHSLGGVVEMIWAKERSNPGTEWKVFHKDRGPTNILRLNNSLAEETNQNQYQSITPTATHFFVQSSLSTNNAEFLAILFRSIDGICKVGTYSGSSVSQTITLGFRPRFFWQKRVGGTGEWHTVDTLRGWGSGTDQFMYFDGSTGTAAYDFGEPTATGLTLTGGADTVSNSGETYIFYAHA